MFNGVTMLNQQLTRSRGCVVDIVVVAAVFVIVTGAGGAVDGIAGGDDGFSGYGR